MNCANTTKMIDNTFETMVFKERISINRYKRPELTNKPPTPTERKITNLFKPLSLTLKLYFLLKKKLVEIPVITLIVFAIR